MHELYKVLKKSFSVFDLDNPVPLKSKITKDLIGFTGIEGRRAHYFLEWYRNRESYLRCIKVGSNIYDLHGLIVRVATLEDEERAQHKIQLVRQWNGKVKKRNYAIK